MALALPAAPIKQGIITTTTKATLLQLEQDKESIEIIIAKEYCERPVISKEIIHDWLSQFGVVYLDDSDAVTRLIEPFLNSVYVYDDKMLVILNYKDGEFCVDFDEVKEAVESEENPDDHIGLHGSAVESHGEPPGARTQHHLIKSQVLYQMS